MAETPIPFRWRWSDPLLERHLGRGPALPLPAAHEAELLRVAIQVLRRAGDVDLVFVGRSPENLHDLLSGALWDTTWRERLQLLQLSLRSESPGRLRRQRPGALEHLWRYFQALGLTPSQLLARHRPVAFVDLVYAGRTFGNLQKVLRYWSGGQFRHWQPVLERLRWVCLVEHGNTRHHAWGPRYSRWAQDVAPEHLTRLRVDWRLWRHLADDQPKTTPPHTSADWGAPHTRRDLEARPRLEAARLAWRLHQQGRAWRPWIARGLEESPPDPAAWQRDLARELRAPAHAPRDRPRGRHGRQLSDRRAPSAARWPTDALRTP